MDLTIKTSSNQNILLEPGVPSGVTFNLPGSRSYRSETENGSIYYEELSSGPFTFRYSIFHFIKKITLYLRQQKPYAGVRIAVENRWNVALNGEDPITVRQNHFVLFSPGNKGEKMVFEKNQQYRGIEILCDPEKMTELMNLYPGIAEFVGDGEEVVK